MKLTRENYEIFFLDYYEGNLSGRQEEDLFDFLQHNSDLREEFQSFEIIYLADDVMPVMENKDLLKKPFDTSVNGKVEQRHLIAYHEGDLDESEKLQVLSAIAEDKKLAADFALYEKTKLVADTSVIFPGKKSLKRFIMRGYLTYINQFAAAAAVIAFLATIYFAMPDIRTGDPVAVVKPEIAATESNTVLTEEAETSAQSESPAPTPTTPEETRSATPSKSTPVKTSPAQQPTQDPVIINPAPRLPAKGLQIFSRRNSDFAQITPINKTWLNSEATPVRIETRDDFYWLTYASIIEVDEEEPEETPDASPRRYSSLASLAYNEIEKSTGINVQDLASKRMGIWDLAGIGLAGIGSLTGTPLTIDKDRDENGRVTSFGIGERFRINR